MKITDIIRGVLDLADMAGAASQPVEPTVVVTQAEPEVQMQAEPETDEEMIAILQKLAGMGSECDQALPEYANTPNAEVAPLGAAFPGGDDVHSRKDPADIRADSVSMYPNYQAPKR